MSVIVAKMAVKSTTISNMPGKKYVRYGASLPGARKAVAHAEAQQQPEEHGRQDRADHPVALAQEADPLARCQRQRRPDDRAAMAAHPRRRGRGGLENLGDVECL